MTLHLEGIKYISEHSDCLNDYGYLTLITWVFQGRFYVPSCPPTPSKNILLNIAVLPHMPHRHIHIQPDPPEH